MPLDPGRTIRVAEHHPDNLGVLTYLRSDERGREAPLAARPGAVADPYYTLGTHPDVVEYLWDRLGAALPEDCRCVVTGTPALVEPASGLLLAVGLGTSYSLRLAPADFEAARAAGAPTTHTYRSADDLTLDVSAWGAGWLFGSYDASDAPRLEAARAHAAARAGRPWAP